MSKVTGSHSLQTDRVHLSDDTSVHKIDFLERGGIVLPDGSCVVPELQHFVNTDYYNTPVEVCPSAVFYTDDIGAKL